MLQADSLPSEPPGKPKNTEVGSLSLLQGIFPTQEPNQGLLHCRRIVYQLSFREAAFSFWDLYNVNVSVFVSEDSGCAYLFSSFFHILFCGSDFHHSVFQVTYPFFRFSYSAIDFF